MRRYILKYSATGKIKGLPFLLTFSLFSAVLFSACEDVIHVNLSKDDLNLFGVEARITTKDGPTVFLYQTLKVDQDISYPGISGAIITVSDNATPSNKIVLSEDPAKKGFYQVPLDYSYLGVAGREYTLSILSSGVTLTAKDKLSKVEPIDSIVVMPSMRGNKIFLGIFTYGREPAGLGNFYKWDVFVNDTLLNKANRIAVANDEFVDGNYIPGLEVFTDFHDQKKPEDRKLNLNDTIVVKHNSISEFGYNFYFQMINQSSTGSLFSIPPANVKSNFTSSDGRPVLGLFAAEDVSVSNTVIINQAIEDQLTK